MISNKAQRKTKTIVSTSEIIKSFVITLNKNTIETHKIVKLTLKIFLNICKKDTCITCIVICETNILYVKNPK